MSLRRFLWAFALLVWAVPAHAAVTLVDDDYISSSNATSTIALTLQGVQTGDYIVTCGLWYGTLDPTFSDDRSNSYVTPFGVTRSSGSVFETYMSYALVGTGGDTVVTLSLNNVSYKGLFVSVWRGLAGASPLDDSDSAFGTSTTPAVPSMTASVVGLAVGCSQVEAATTITPDGGWTQLREDESWTNVAGSSVYQLTTVGGYAPAWTIGASSEWTAVGVILKEAASSSVMRSLLLGVGP